MHPYYDRLQAPVTPVPPQDQNPFVAGVVSAAHAALNLPVRSTWNDEDIIDGTGFFEIGYRPETNTRSSSSICYLHPAQRSRPNLHVLLRTRALRLLLDGDNRASGVLVRTAGGAITEIAARAGLAVPGAVAVSGWDDSEAAGPAGLTTLAQSLRDQGSRCARLALGHREPPGQDQPHWEVIPRSTTRPRPA